jgi:hypothetical protein
MGHRRLKFLLRPPMSMVVRGPELRRELRKSKGLARNKRLGPKRCSRILKVSNRLPIPELHWEFRRGEFR